MTDKPILALDFDGCIHKYSQGWKNGKIYDPPVEGFFEWAAEAAKHFRLIVHSSRATTPGGRDMIQDWIRQEMKKPWLRPLNLEIRGDKPPAWLTIDDRCVRFEGDWAAPELNPEVLLAFRPWMQK